MFLSVGECWERVTALNLCHVHMHHEGGGSLKEKVEIGTGSDSQDRVEHGVVEKCQRIVPTEWNAQFTGG